MVNGLNIDSTEFKKLKTKQQLTILYENTEELKSMISSYKLQQKLQWGVITLLFILLGATKFMGVF